MSARHVYAVEQKCSHDSLAFFLTWDELFRSQNTLVLQCVMQKNTGLGWVTGPGSGSAAQEVQGSGQVIEASLRNAGGVKWWWRSTISPLIKACIIYSAPQALNFYFERFLPSKCFFTKLYWIFFLVKKKNSKPFNCHLDFWLKGKWNVAMLSWSNSNEWNVTSYFSKLQLIGFLKLLKSCHITILKAQKCVPPTWDPMSTSSLNCTLITIPTWHN